MPTYEYVCSKCGHEFEKVHSMSEKPLSICPKELCGMKTWGKGKVKKMIGAGAGLIFKGSGFYITDYRSEQYKEAAKKDTPPAPASTPDTKPNAPGSSPAATPSTPAATTSAPPPTTTESKPSKSLSKPSKSVKPKKSKG